MGCLGMFTLYCLTAAYAFNTQLFAARTKGVSVTVKFYLTLKEYRTVCHLSTASVLHVQLPWARISRTRKISENLLIQNLFIMEV